MKSKNLINGKVSKSVRAAVVAAAPSTSKIKLMAKTKAAAVYAAASAKMEASRHYLAEN